MSFQTGLSGLKAASINLDVIGNNIANVNTVGMKESRAEFADMVAANLGVGGFAVGPGIGVATATIAQQFTQGNLTITGNALDVAVNGQGFFQVTKTNGDTAYTRDGQFKLDKNGYLLTNTGANVMGYPTDSTGAASSVTPQKLVIPTAAPIPAKATTTISAGINLDSRAKIASTVSPPTPRSTYGTSVTTFDSQGNPLPLTLYFTKITPGSGPVAATTPATDQWAVYDHLDTTTPAQTYTPIGYMSFDSTGALANSYDATGAVSTPIGKLKLTITNPNTTPGDIKPTLDLSKVTQYGVAFSVSSLSQDGYTSGEFTGLNIDSKGVITTQYSNGQTLKTGGMLALGDFRNVQGLSPIGNGEYLETYKSGPVLLGSPMTSKFGETRSGALEESNVDLTSELVNMMTAQRDYQANAQTIKTQDQIMSTLVNLR